MNWLRGSASRHFLVRRSILASNLEIDLCLGGWMADRSKKRFYTPLFRLSFLLACGLTTVAGGEEKRRRGAALQKGMRFHGVRRLDAALFFVA